MINNCFKSVATKVGFGLLLLSCGLFPGNSAKAALVAVLSPTSAANTFVYDINFLNTTDTGTGMPSERLDAPGTGNPAFATVYDLVGATSITLNPAYAGVFSLTTQNVGITPSGLAPTDSASLINFTVNYIGPMTTTSFSDSAVVTVVSSSATRGTAAYTGQDTKNAGGAAGTLAINAGSVTVPVSSTPEPAAMFLMGGGLLGLGALGRRKRKV